jgi:hypothetical protein
MRAKRVKMEVTNLGAVYINDIRVTGRHTKWGTHLVVFSRRVAATRVTANLVKHGYGHIKLDADYATEAGVV